MFVTYICVSFQGMEDVIPSVQEVESLDSMKFLTKAELVEQIVRPLEEVCGLKVKWFLVKCRLLCKWRA